MTVFRTPYDGLAAIASLESGVSFEGPGKTQQQFREECDINTIVRRFGITGQAPAPDRLPEYGDFSQVTDFFSAQLAVREATERFMTLPSSVRERFANDPQRLLEFVSDEENREEGIKLGLFNAPVPAPVSAEPAKSA